MGYLMLKKLNEVQSVVIDGVACMKVHALWSLVDMDWEFEEVRYFTPENFERAKAGASVDDYSHCMKCGKVAVHGECDSWAIGNFCDMLCTDCYGTW